MSDLKTKHCESCEGIGQPLSKEQMNYFIKLAGLFAVTIAVIMLLSNQTTWNLFKRDVVENKVVASTEKSKMTVVFEGVFMSDKNKVALINKAPMQVGDLLNGMPIVEIDQEYIRVKGDKGILELKAGATYLI